MELPAIPWAHSASDFGSVWQWKTPQFTATVTGDARLLYWRIVDTASPTERLLADGNAAMFNQAETLIRETVGKAYPPSAGYRHYAGNLANTFTIANGQPFDFTPWTNRTLTLTVITDPNPHKKDHPDTTTVVGNVSVNHYEILIDVTTPDNEPITYRITPTYITHIANEQGYPLQPVTTPKTNDSHTRITDGTWTRGCTGVPGYLPSTVDHTGRIPCPLHELATQ